MARSAADLAALKDELTNDPNNLGLTTLEADDAANATKLNAVVVGQTVKKRAVTTSDVFNAVPPLDYQAMSPQQRTWFDAMLTLGQVDAFSQSAIIDGLTGNDGVFADAAAAKIAVNAILQEDGNRIDQMFQQGLLEVGGTVTPSDVAQARQLP